MTRRHLMTLRTAARAGRRRHGRRGLPARIRDSVRERSLRAVVGRDRRRRSSRHCSPSSGWRSSGPVGLYRCASGGGWLAEARDIVRGTRSSCSRSPCRSSSCSTRTMSAASSWCSSSSSSRRSRSDDGRPCVARRWFESFATARARHELHARRRRPVRWRRRSRTESSHTPPSGCGSSGTWSLDRQPGPSALTRPVLGLVDEISDVFEPASSTRWRSACHPGIETYLEPIVAIAAGRGKTVRVPRDRTRRRSHGALQEEFDGFLVHSVVHDGHRDSSARIKRVVDVSER